jgi:hypothetical protein
MATRKSKEEFCAEHELFLDMMRTGHPALKIASELNLSQPQLKEHMFQAFKNGEVHTEDYKPTYEMIKKKSLPKTIREMLAKFYQLPDEDNALVKIEIHNDGILLSIYTAMPPKNMADKNEIVVIDKHTDSSESVNS